MSIQQSAQSSSAADSRRDCAKPQARTAAHAVSVMSAEYHEHPEREPGIGYGRSSGYVSRHGYQGAGRYSKSASPSLFRFH
ncbi:hypothetical protein [Novilysobacter antarcticus]|uniref:hypothetical protein n=1 Tax=Novilysobacter antarcticus TaxID=2862543 RepID=UPI001C999F41|nr:hypothetical protein [Lysobacter antarcticus]